MLKVLIFEFPKLLQPINTSIYLLNIVYTSITLPYTNILKPLTFMHLIFVFSAFCTPILKPNLEVYTRNEYKLLAILKLRLKHKLCCYGPAKCML